MTIQNTKYVDYFIHIVLSLLLKKCAQIIYEYSIYNKKANGRGNIIGYVSTYVVCCSVTKLYPTLCDPMD